MNIVVTALISALVTGIRTNDIVYDYYRALKALLKERFGNDSDVVVAIDMLETKPESTARQLLLEEEVVSVVAASDERVSGAAQALLDEIRSQRSNETRYFQHGIGPDFLPDAQAPELGSVSIEYVGGDFAIVADHGLYPLETVAGDGADGAVAADIQPPASSRQIVVTGYADTGKLTTVFEAKTHYFLRFGVGASSEGNLARGDVDVTDVPDAGLKAKWIVTSSNVELLDVSPMGKVEKIGDTWLAEFELLIPGKGSSESVMVGVRTTEKRGELALTLLVGGEEYRKLLLSLQSGAEVIKDVVCTAPDHLNLRTPHEWATPPAHLEVNVFGQAARISTIRGGDDYGTTVWTAGSVVLKNPIVRVRNALERFRVVAESQLNDLDVADMQRRLDNEAWKLYDDWHVLDSGAPVAHGNEPASPGSEELRNLANEGYRLFDSCFPKASLLRNVIEGLTPGSRLDFVWTELGDPNWVAHVPWALMFMKPVGLSDRVDPALFFGIRFRIGSKSWEPQAPSRALGDPDQLHTLNFLYWGADPKDEVGVQSQWQRQEFSKRSRQSFVPDLSALDAKAQVIQALEQPEPHPVGVLYFFCHCGVKDGSDPVLQFGDTAKQFDVIEASDIYPGVLAAAPFVFANACTTAAADPLGTSELESRFFARNARAFLGTEAKVPVTLASRFAWLFFHFFFRGVQNRPVSAGESLAQARLFLWTQYRSLGGLFYCLVNRYDLFYASDEEVSQLQNRG